MSPKVSYFCSVLLLVYFLSLTFVTVTYSLQQASQAVEEEEMSASGTGTPASTSTQVARRAFIGGNWKCNGLKAKVAELTAMLNNFGEVPAEAEVVVAVPAIHITSVMSTLRQEIAVSSQDVCVHPGQGAYTGELSAALLKDVGLNWTLVGHSERRVGFGIPGETSAVVAAKTKAAIGGGLGAILCIGEQLADRESGRTMDVCAEQLSAVKSALSEADWGKIVLAYEPVWAIGTGKVASPEQAEETHKNIRAWLSDNVSPEVATNIRIIYGGSVKANNCQTLIACPNIDGFLVGGASLLPEFVDIINCARLYRK